MLETISVAIACIAVSIAVTQTIIARRAAQGALIVEMLDKFWEDENRVARRDVSSLKGRLPQTWSDSDIAAAEKVAHQLSLVGFVTKNSYASRRVFMEYWGVRAIVAYQILEPFILSRRAANDSNDQWVDFEWLARATFKYLERRKVWWNTARWARLRARTRLLSLDAI